MSYIRLCQSVYDKGLLIKPEDLWDSIKDPSKEYFISLYEYNEEHYKTFQKTKSIKGIRDTLTNKLFFDLDSKDNPILALEDSKILINNLFKHGIKEKNIEIYYTGKKGFHILVSLNRQLSPTLAYSLAVNKFGKDLKTLDTSVYDASQIIRVPGTKHSSGLYKIPLTLNQLKTFSLEEIKERAKSLSNITENFEWEELIASEEFYKVEEQPKIVKKTDIKFSVVDNINKIKGWRNCKFSLLQGNFTAGNRHQALLVIAATCRGLGHDKHSAYYMCKSALKKQAARTGTDDFPKEELWNNIIESIYKDDWKGGQYTCTQLGWLQTYCQSLKEPCGKEESDSIKTQKISDIESQFKDFVINIDKNTIKTGLTAIDEVMPLTIGNNLAILGAASSGKTALALDVLKNTSKTGVKSVFASLDMHRNRLFEKLLYKVSNGKSREEIYTMFQQDKQKPLIDKINEEYGNVYFYDRSCPTVGDIRKYIEKINEDNPNDKVKLVMLDYFERINSDKSDETAGSKDVAGQLQDLIADFNICIITLVQPNKFSLGGGPDSPILNYTAIKGSSFLYQSFRSILSIWRPFFTPLTKQHDKFIQMAILKNDLGELDTFDYRFEGRTGTIRELTYEEQNELELLLKEKNDSKDGKTYD